VEEAQELGNTCLAKSAVEVAQVCGSMLTQWLRDVDNNPAGWLLARIHSRPSRGANAVFGGKALRMIWVSHESNLD